MIFEEPFFEFIGNDETINKLSYFNNALLVLNFQSKKLLDILNINTIMYVKLLCKFLNVTNLDKPSNFLLLISMLIDPIPHFMFEKLFAYSPFRLEIHNQITNKIITFNTLSKNETRYFRYDGRWLYLKTWT